MADPVETPAVAPGAAPVLSDAELASVEVAKRGLAEPTGVNTPADPAADARPDYIPEKFWKDGKADLEGLAKSYAELERTRAPAPAAVEEPAKAEPKVGADGKIVAPEAVEGAPAPLAAAMEAARTEWASSQEVSEETVASLEAAGIPKEIFNLYIEGVKAQQAAAIATIHGFAGDADQYNAMAAWAGTNVSEADLDAFNNALDDPNARETAVRGMMARYAEARPSEGNLITPAGTPSEAGDVYADRAELTADQKNPLYATDAKFRQNVMDKLVRSQRGGFQLVARPMFERQIHTR